MRRSLLWLVALLFVATTTTAFTIVGVTPQHRPCSVVVAQTAAASNDNDNDDATKRRKQEIIQQEAMNKANLKASAAQLEKASAGDFDKMLQQVENMSAAEREQMQKMGMDPAMMRQAMQMMRDNPSMKAQVAQMMKDMTPEQIMQQSRAAQAAMKGQGGGVSMPAAGAAAAGAGAGAGATASTSPSVTDAQIEENKEDDDDDDDDEEEEEPIELDPEVLNAMFRVGEIMSEPPTGGVTLAALESLPPIAALMGTADDDLTVRELREAWSAGSLGATRLDRQGFERVWAAIQEDYYNDICEEARERLVQRKRKRRGAATAKPTSPPLATTTAPQPPPNMVGTSLTPEQLQASIKNMKDEDLDKMFEQMSNMSPAEEARLRSMGVDPTLMKKSASALKSNPLLRKAATMMMKNTSPEQLMKASQEAQQRMSNMTEEEKQRMLDNLK